MKFGVCCVPDNFVPAKKAGLDYAEISMAYLHGKSDAELREIKQKAAENGLYIDGFNGFFGSGISLYNDALETVLDYSKVNFETANILDGQYCVLGCGWLRKTPEGKDKAETEKRFAYILSQIAELAGAYGVELILEPLCKEETDIINTFEEGLRLCRAADIKSLGCLVDFYHFYKNGEDLSVFDDLREGEPRHVHLARANDDRAAPGQEDRETLQKWAEKLKKAGYDRRISLECRWSADFESDLITAASLLKEIF